jgi:hypothetical protein
MSTGKFRETNNDETTQIFETADATTPTREYLKAGVPDKFRPTNAISRNNSILQLNKGDLQGTSDEGKIERAFGVLADVIDAVPDDSLNDKNAFAEAVWESLQKNLKTMDDSALANSGFSTSRKWRNDDVDSYIKGPSICLWIDAAFDTAVSKLPLDERATMNVDALRSNYTDRILESM